MKKSEKLKRRSFIQGIIGVPLAARVISQSPKIQKPWDQPTPEENEELESTFSVSPSCPYPGQCCVVPSSGAPEDE